ncbi:Dihydrofolate reductase [Micromonospora echinaurantiaca]|uniref:Dihydrofolate reductase n=1 Tax=Micromonospora echinaurantiaca TaxID=47857 RepID=A0A1C5IGB3_9ACTN|nr:dihydrofolate reductase family protein [Micromonospora echinaurantiaca]SCG57294.1 Dihydrofolate reductase [Micromonospora echinaurantiaca]
MRKLIVCNIMSLNGYYEGPGKDIMALPVDHPFHAYNLERLGTASTLLLGRRTYEAFRGYWPSIAEDESQRPVWREISRLLNTIEHVVISDRLTAEMTQPWQHLTKIVRRADAYDEVVNLKRSEGKDILVFGSHVLWNDLLTSDLVDELHLIVGALILSDGTPTFELQSPVSLTPKDVRILESSRNILIRYAVDRGSV